ncbi:MAG: cysteine-rich repeat protein [Bradymonadia bacterium]|jgi:cysteine-rich repeat protein
MLCRLLPFLFVLGFAACGDDAPIYFIAGDVLPGDAGAGDVSADTLGDAQTDVDADTADDVDPDAETDAGDTESDAEADVDPDAQAEEICDSEEDEDEDGDTDCADTDCADDEACQGGENCGDGVLQASEDCDDGNTDDGDGCDAECSLEPGFVNSCGDGVAVGVAGEQCDDGADNSDEPDACREDCTLPICGDAILDSDEICDPGVFDVESICTAECQLIVGCGDGDVEAPEQCDDGNDNPDDGCHLCELTGESECGDGFYAPDFEECDEGAGCAGDDFCSDGCECITPFCGNFEVEGAEECDGAACAGGDRCESCECVATVCGDGVIDLDESCDTSDAACGESEFCNGDCSCEEFACGDGSRDGIEECDGDDDAACGASGGCDDACECATFECGNDIQEGSEECDGSDDSACGGSEICLPACSCGSPAANPVLEPLIGDLTAGFDPALTVEPWDAAYCDEENPHGFVIRLEGSTSAQIDRATFLISEFDGTTREFEAPLSSAGSFSVDVEVCLPTVPEGLRVRTTVVDRLGRTSNAVNWTFPTLSSATLTSFAAFEARDPAAHVFRLVGSSEDHNIEQARFDLIDSAGGSLAADFDVRVTPEFSGSSYVATSAIGGVEGLDISTYNATIVTFAGVESSQRTVTLRSTPGSGADCIPTVTAGTPTCSGTLVCQETTSTAVGRCVAGSTIAPTLTSLTGGSYEVGSSECGADFPDYLSWTITGSSPNPIVGYTLQAADFGAEPFALGLTPLSSGSFSERVGVCSTVAPSGPITIVLIHEGGRTSAARSFTL